jgi:hypothetical protein
VWGVGGEPGASRDEVGKERTEAFSPFSGSGVLEQSIRQSCGHVWQSSGHVRQSSGGGVGSGASEVDARGS